MKIKLIKFIVFFAFILITTLPVVFAAQLSVNSDTSILQREVETKFSVTLNSNGEVINATEGAIYIDPKCWEFKELNFTNSSIVLWIEQPKFENNRIHYAGITPGGISGTELKIINFIAIPKSKSSCGFSIENPKVLLNDGKGSETSVKVLQNTFSATDNNLNIATEFNDKVSPENFVITLTKDPIIFNNEYFVVFNTIDKDSGIDYYEISETDISDPTNVKEWKKASSPYKLTNQVLDNFIHVKAVDKKGNYKYSTLNLKQNKENLSLQQIAFFLFLLAIVLTLSAVYFKKRNHEKK